MQDGFTYVGLRAESDLADRFDTARRLDRRNRSDALRVAMEAYIEQIAESRSHGNGDSERGTESRAAADAARKQEAIG